MHKPLFYILLLLVCACAAPEQKPVEIATPIEDTIVPIVHDTTTQEQEFKPIVNDSINNIFRYVSGMQPSGSAGVKEEYLKNSDWKHYTWQVNYRWGLYDSTRMKIIKRWRNEELKPELPGRYNLFYPFSGPDFLNAALFFPEADTVVMIGLEPSGTIPNLDSLQKDTLKNYFENINTSLSSILTCSFFRTISMEEDLKREDVNGTTHLLGLFLQHSNCNIVAYNYVSIDSAGNWVKTSEEKHNAVEFQYLDAENKLHVLYYLSQNITDNGLASKKNVTLNLSRLTNKVTYLKSASYLMHKAYFSRIRNLIVAQSLAILQDDSGLPYFAIDTSIYNVKLYGAYKKPIDLFAKHFQENLKYAYDSLKSKKIPFGIGYQFRRNESNMQWFKRK